MAERDRRVIVFGLVVAGGFLLLALVVDERKEQPLHLVPLAALPRDAVFVLSEFFPRELLERVDLQVAVPARVVVCCAPAAQPSALVKVGANPGPEQIVIHPSFFNTRTAEGLALIGHELFHVMQRQTDPDFEERFEQAALETARRGLPPWANPFEAKAYAFERRLRAELERRGFPVGVQA